jgi:tetratricopeptide (TPR) repeat protein
MRSDRLPPNIDERIHKEKDNTVKFYLLQEFADAAVEEGEFMKAMQLYEQALVVAQKMRNRKLQSRTLIDLGFVADNLGEIELAINYYQKALELAKRMRDFDTQSLILGKLGILSISTHEFDLATEYFDKGTIAADTAMSIPVQEEEIAVPQDTSRRIVRGSKPSSGLSPLIELTLEVSSQIEQERKLHRLLPLLTVAVDSLLIIVIISISSYFVFTPSSKINASVGILVLALIASILILIGSPFFLKSISTSSEDEQ